MQDTIFSGGSRAGAPAERIEPIRTAAEGRGRRGWGVGKARDFVVNKAWPFSGLVLISLWLVRLAYVWGKLAVSCPEGPWPAVRFGLAAGVVVFGPGLFFHRALRIECGSMALRLLLVVAMSLGAVVLFSWQLYFFGAYTRAALAAGLFAMAIGGIYGLMGVGIQRPIRQLKARWNALHGLDRLGIALGLVFWQGLFESSVGAPFTEWDALVSWDKWAVDMSLRQGLGQYVMGGYPQFFPTLHSVFYKIAGTGGAVLPMEHLLLHGFAAIHVAVLMLSLWCLGRMLRVPGLLAFLLFVWNRNVHANLISGYVDIPLVAATVAAVALAMGFCEGMWSAKRGKIAEGWILSLVLFAVAFMKGNGLAWVVWIFLYMAFRSWKNGRLRAVFLSAGMAFLYVAPFFGHQFWYSRHFERAEQSPFLHVFRLVPAHTSLFTPNAEHGRFWLERLAEFHLVPAAWGPWVLAVALVLGLWALCQRRLFFFSLVGFLMLALWFYTGSYDLRNAYVPLVFLCFSVVAAPFDPRLGRWGRIVRFALVLGAVWIGAYGKWKSQTVLFPGNPLYPFPLPPAATLPVASRHMALRPGGDVRNLLYETPWGRRAVHLNAATSLYRFLAPRGTYAIQENSFKEAKRHDLFVMDRAAGIPRGFAPIANLLQIWEGQILCVFEPGFRPVDATIQLGEGARTEPLGAGVSLAANRRYEVSVVPPAAAGKEDVPRDGILSLRISPSDADVAVALHPDDARRDPYASYLGSIRDGEWIRLLYWMRDGGPAIPRLTVAVGGQDVRLSAVEWGQ